jgi:menaquinone-dependent protoporphyrinogen oxidase
MPRLLIVYGTTDGQTAKICTFLAAELLRLGVTVDIAEAGDQDTDPNPYDGIIVAGSIHAGGYQKALVRWARRHAMVLTSKPAVFLSVCLGILETNPKTRAELDRILDQFAHRTGWRPAAIKEVAGALKYTQYGWLKRLALRYIAGKAGGATDTTRDHEYTNWEDLRAFARSLVEDRLTREPFGRSPQTAHPLEAGHTASAR